ncbi:hypothetical protein A2U01_0117942, partial [Trifolium medium]|nr:hypothetical protein [Trifolium medium]
SAAEIFPLFDLIVPVLVSLDLVVPVLLPPIPILLR